MPPSRLPSLFYGLTLCFGVLLSCAQVQAQAAEDSARAMLYLAIGGGGETDLDSDGGGLLGGLLGGSADNDASVGFGARVEKPLFPYLSLGGMVDFLSYAIDGGDRQLSGHFDLWAKARTTFDLGSNLSLEPYLGVPFGFSVMGTEESTILKRERRFLGWNVGVLAGAQLLFSQQLGLMAELGWRRIQAYNEIESSGIDLTSRTNQLAFNLGGVLLF